MRIAALSLYESAEGQGTNFPYQDTFSVLSNAQKSGENDFVVAAPCGLNSE